MIEIDQRVLGFIVVIAYCSLVFAVRENQLESLLKTYDKNRSKTVICQEYFYVQQKNPCQQLINEVVETRTIGPDSIHISSEVITGDTEEKNGYRLIVNETLTIDIPAIMKCIPKYKNTNIPIRINNKYFVYYLIMYFDEKQQRFEKVLISDRREENKTVFALQDAQLMVYILETYQNSNNDERKPIIYWFNKNKSPVKAKKNCEHLSALGQLTEKVKPASWIILEGSVDVEPYTLRVTKTIEVRVRGLMHCKVEVKEKNDSKPIIKTRHFCLAKPDTNNKSENHIFTNIYYGGDKRKFVFNQKLLPK